MVDRRRRWAVVAALVIVLAGAGPASAQSVSGGELRALAARAASDPRALAQLRGVREVDGRPVDVARALAGADGPELAARLRTLAGGGDAPAGGAGDPRADAASVLEGRRFHKPKVPRPFAGVLRTLGGWLEPLVAPLRWVWRHIDANVPARAGVVAAVFALALWITTRLVGRRGAQAVRRSRSLGVEAGGLDPDELEREADAAERAGDLDHAVRLRFVAGILRLDGAGVIAYRSSLTTGQLRSRVGSASFAELAAAFDEIAYGGRRAEPSDVETAKSTWPRILAETRR